jgi:hypothetical protein
VALHNLSRLASLVLSSPQYWNGVYFALLVFDVTNPESFDSVKQWNEELKKARWEREDVEGMREREAWHMKRKNTPPGRVHMTEMDLQGHLHSHFTA